MESLSSLRIYNITSIPFPKQIYTIDFHGFINNIFSLTLIDFKRCSWFFHTFSYIFIGFHRFSLNSKDFLEFSFNFCYLHIFVLTFTDPHKFI
jgi:hypothetical protein